MNSYFVKSCSIGFYFLFASLLFSTACCATAEKVYFAGFAFLGDHSTIEAEYPFSGKIWKTDENQHLREKMIVDKLASVSNPDIELIVGELGDHKSGNALSLALALDWEDVCVEELSPGLFKIVLNLHGQILIYDFSELKIVASYPFGVRVNDASETRPDDAHIMSLFEKLYFEKIGQANFIDEFISKLQLVKTGNTSKYRIKVTDVDLGEKCLAWMPEKIKCRPEVFKAFVAQQFSSFLTASQNVPVLPYTQGHAIKGKMALRFNDGGLLSLQVPKEDIPIRIAVRGFKKVKLDENHAGTAWVYGSFIKFTALDAFGDPLIDTQFKYAAVKKVPATQSRATIESDWSAFQESLLSLLSQLSEQISARSPDWLEKKTKEKDAAERLEKLCDVLKECV